MGIAQQYWAIAGIAAGGALAACSSGAPSAEHSRASLLDDSAPIESGQSPARWRYHPPQSSVLRGQLSLPGGDHLFVGDHGERWLTDKTGVTPSSFLAPEGLLISVPLSLGFLFVGASGTAYESRTALGPFVRSSAPPMALTQIAAFGTKLVGIRGDGRLMRTENAGATWQVVGPERRRFVDVGYSVNVGGSGSVTVTCGAGGGGGGSAGAGVTGVFVGVFISVCE